MEKGPNSEAPRVTQKKEEGMAKEGSKVVSLHLPAELHAKVKQAAEEASEARGSFVSRTALIVEAIEAHLDGGDSDARLKALEGMWPALDDAAKEFVMEAARYAKGGM